MGRLARLFATSTRAHRTLDGRLRDKIAQLTHLSKDEQEELFQRVDERIRKVVQEVNVAQAEAKRLRAEALARTGGRYVVALETAKMFDNIDAAVMTPEQYIAFVRQAWGLIGVGGGSVPAPLPAEKK